MLIQIKGGVWKNTEDEVLKAAVMKYGLNNWSRVSSLLVNKSAKQCKARWFEWLDPHIKKTEWSREEEEKLLHLAKLFPTQWRTIGPLIGRTAYQCLQHYERLLDQAQGREEDDQFDPRKLRPGEIDPQLECKPSRADAVDMDDDEKEMLAEARARLANTRGKKAKRKAREKALEQSKRIAMLQKRRELKSAGINVRNFKMKKITMDYEKEIPFEMQPPKGFYPPDEERPANLSIKNIEQLEGIRRDQEMNKLRKDDIRKLKRLQSDDTPAAMSIFEKYDKSKTLKNKLVLPEPTMTDDEINQIIKMGADIQLLENVANSTVARTPMTTSIMEEARIAAMANRLQTPLEGEMNFPDSSFPVPPTPSQFQTPNPIKQLMAQTPLTIFGSRSSSAFTPRPSEPSVYDDASDSDPIGSKARLDMARLYVKASLSNLPEPEGNVEVTIPDIETMEEEEVEQDLDMEEIERRKQELEKKKQEERELLETQVIQRKLPRPVVFNSIVFVNDLENTFNESQSKYNQLINEEFVNLLAYDSVKHPIPHGRPADQYKPKEYFDLKLIEESRKLIDSEAQNLSRGLEDSNLLLEWKTSNFKYSHLQKRYMPCEKLTLQEQKLAEEMLCKEYEKHLENLSKRIKSLENKYNVSTGGYRSREEKILKEIGEMYDSIIQSTNDYNSFKEMEQVERRSSEERISFQLSQLQKEKSMNRKLQV
uniref:Myb-like DNA binding protein (CDC5 homologue), putative n=1 Tax=Theileria annulata TaxID=5874 RepID=A0A3B0MI25_THEAN